MVSGRAKKDSEAENMVSISERVMPWLMRPKNPSVSAAWISWWVISGMREGKSWREILGMVRVVYFVVAIVVSFVNDQGVRSRFVD